jgi:hypothetical protein
MIASSLFHFTKSLDTLMRIIDSGSFRVSYNIEDISDFYPKQKFIGIPMSCFCDIPLKFISEHPRNYGDFGIGLKKEWGTRNGVNPILYRIQDSIINQSMKQIIETTRPSSSDEVDRFKLVVVGDHAIKLSSFTKPYFGQNKHTNYLDREWRYVPRNSQLILVDKQSRQMKEKLNHQLNVKPLSFEIPDIRHIIVPRKKEVEILISKISRMTVSAIKRQRLAQLVIDLETIKDDF